MYPQSGIGEQDIPLPPVIGQGGIYLAQVIGVLPSDHAVQVIMSATSFIGNTDTAKGLKVKVLEHRAGPYLGDLGLPRVGDWGLVVFPNGSDQMAVWLGSLYQDFNNIATANPEERISHQDSGVYWRMAKDGTVEFVHPSGTYVRLGTGTALATRTRQERQGETRREVPYAIPPKPAITLHLKHSSGTLVSVDPSGNVTVTGKGTKAETIDQAVMETYKSTKTETVEGAVTEGYKAGWSLTVTQNGTVEVTGNLAIKADDLTLMSTNPSPGIHMHLGGTSGEDWIALKAGLDAIKAAFDAHTHPGVQPGWGSTGVPVAMPAFQQDTHYSGQAKVT